MMKDNKKLIITYSFIGLFIASCSSVQVTEEAVYSDSVQSIEVSSSKAYDTPTESKALFANATVYFEFDKYNLSTRSIQALKGVIELMKENDSIEITIAGHADERGTREYNLALGQRRAESVADYMVLKGISRSRLTIKSYGEEMPMMQGSNERSWARNRRAEIN
ncbi:MAG: peptidoglycan-associated lipoprotein Pal [SAR86 cluster bacterium]|uniref:Peptidoglycan-associated lipoprotein Pal n=1 Tax=SAR86 cluster bacterium TaxID=2030880 RepID=A0A520MCD1_9GAMM|nr:MAG: peptidoglycan-associated lipoprotein Pal [SAR86 cluster bacterium]